MAGANVELSQLRNYERINVIGTPGSGKTTFASELSELLGLPCHRMDELFWKPDWQMSTDEELSAAVHAATDGQRWILDGNYNHTTSIKWRSVQLVVWLDLPFVQTVYRVTKRSVQRSLTREELWPGTGNRESFKRSFLSKESIIWWAMTMHGKYRKQYTAATQASDYAHIDFLRLRTARSVAECLNELRQATRSAPSGT